MKKTGIFVPVFFIVHGLQASIIIDSVKAAA